VTSYLTSQGYTSVKDFEKLQKARKLSPSEYVLNSKLGFITLNISLNANQTLAVAYQYTVIGQDKVYQVGEFSDQNIADPADLRFKSGMAADRTGEGQGPQHRKHRNARMRERRAEQNTHEQTLLVSVLFRGGLVRCGLREDDVSVVTATHRDPLEEVCGGREVVDRFDGQKSAAGGTDGCDS
jgi:hypothetical protein